MQTAVVRMTRSVISAALLILAVSTVFESSRTKAAAATTRYQSGGSSTPRHKIGNTYYDYMDSPYYCSGYGVDTLTDFHSYDNDAYVKAWSYDRYSVSPMGSCLYSFSSYGLDHMKFKFNNLQINDCNVKVKVYLSSTTTGSPDVCIFVIH